MSIDVKKQVAYWRKGARGDMDVARVLLEARKTAQALFFLHLALEKTLKAEVVRATRELAPRTHDLVALAGRSKVRFSGRQLKFLAAMNRFSIEARYPSSGFRPPGVEAAQRYVTRAKEMVDWLTKLS